MKFTEGFWEKSEAAHACYAVQAYEVEEIENGMRVTATVPDHLQSRVRIGRRNADV